MAGRALLFLISLRHFSHRVHQFYLCPIQQFQFTLGLWRGIPRIRKARRDCCGSLDQGWLQRLLCIRRSVLCLVIEISLTQDEGPCPDLKFPTVMARLAQSHIQPAQLFFRTSAASRSTNRFLHENRLLPPLAYSTCISALESLKNKTEYLHLHFADEEGDPYAVQLAGRLDGYVLGADSDFVIFKSEGYRGYIPLEELVWQTPPSEDVNEDSDEGDFQKVHRNKVKRKASQARYQHGNGLLPAEGAESITFVAYAPETLATHLKIPVTLLPLFAALAGNDYSKESELNNRKIQSLFFERNSTPVQRIEKVAATIHSVVSPTAKRKAKFDSVMDLIDQTTNTLLVRQTWMSPTDVREVVEKIVNATLQYAIPRYEGNPVDRSKLWANKVCALHAAEVCPFLPMISQNVMREADSSQPDPRHLEARELYLDAYRAGLFSFKHMDVLSTGSCWPRLFLENQDLETVARSIGGPIRRWTFSILDDAVGIPTVHHDEDEESRADDVVEAEEGEESDQEELVDVVESDSDAETDFLAPLKGELQRLHSGSEEDVRSQATDPPPSIISHRSQRTGKAVVTEYVRRGTRIALEPTTVKSISGLLASIDLESLGEDEAPPLTLQPENTRFQVFLRILGSDEDVIRGVPSEMLLPVLSVRWVVQSMDSRWKETGSREREKERWSKKEAFAFISAFSWPEDSVSEEDSQVVENPPILDRNVQLIAQASMAMDTINQLSQALLLTDKVKRAAQRLSGKKFHALLTEARATEIPNNIMVALVWNLEEAFQPDSLPKKKKTSKASKVASPAPAKKTRGASGLYALLGNME